MLINVEGDVKLADFGISRRGFDDVKYSRPFACRYYRPPEILLGAKTYNHTVDIWALGCIIGEFYTRNPLFVGKSLSAIISLTSRSHDCSSQAKSEKI